ncbi:MAG TPA: diacylglycerol kinase family lipid kinase [Chloroflexota bacterium]|nr:diacylglycerol kinase family lipid kinase [Chloroflexota bacterium]
MPKYQKVKVIINPAAGKDEPILNTLNDVFHPHGVIWDVGITLKFGDATRLAQEAAASGQYDLVAGYGGDGTQMEIANGLRGSGVPMAILPGGTGNAMAFELNVPRELRAAAELIVNSENVKAVDLVKANDTYFMLRLYSGVDEEQKTSREQKDKYGILAYPLSILEMGRELNHADYRLTIDGEVIEERGVACFVVNAGSIGGVALTFDAEIDVTDGLLDVFMINTSLSTLRSAIGRFLRLPTEQAGLHYWRGKEIVMEVDPPQTIWVDGELLGKTPLTITAVPAAVKIVVP